MDGRVLDRIASLRPGKKKVDWNVAGTRAKGKWCGGKGRERRGKGRTSRFVVIRSEQEKKGWVNGEGSSTRVYKQHQRDPRQHRRSLNGQWGLFTSLDEKEREQRRSFATPHASYIPPYTSAISYTVSLLFPSAPVVFLPSGVGVPFLTISGAG